VAIVFTHVHARPHDTPHRTTGKERFQKEEKLKQLRESEIQAREAGEQRRETKGMREEEARQRDLGDSFWGQDEELRKQESLLRDMMEADLTVKARKERLIAKHKQDQIRKDQAAERERQHESDERGRMGGAEVEQCRADTFWGLEQERRVRIETLADLAIEDALSRQFQEDAKQELQHDKWETGEEERRSGNYMKMLQNEKLWQRKYMKAFRKAASSAELVHYLWPNPFSVEKWYEGEEHKINPASSDARHLYFDKQLPNDHLVAASQERSTKLTKKKGKARHTKKQTAAREKKGGQCKSPRNVSGSPGAGGSQPRNNHYIEEQTSLSRLDSKFGNSYPPYSRLAAVQDSSRRDAPQSTFHLLITDTNRQCKSTDIHLTDSSFELPSFSQDSLNSNSIRKKYAKHRLRMREQLEASKMISRKQSHHTPVLPLIGRDSTSLLPDVVPSQIVAEKNQESAETIGACDVVTSDPTSVASTDGHQPSGKSTKTVLRKVFHLIDLDDSGNIEKNEIIEAFSNDEEVREVLCEHRPLQGVLLKTGRRLDEVFAGMDTDRR
jgi:hypothetical protein